MEPEQPTLRGGFPHSAGERHLPCGGQIRSQHNQQKYEEVQGTVPDKVRLRIRFSLDNLKLDDDVLNIPLFMADQADRLIGLALEKMKQ